MEAYQKLRRELFASRMLYETGVDGLYARSGMFEQIVTAIGQRVSRVSAEDRIAGTMQFAPIMSRAHFERSGYMKSFPQMAGTVHCFCGSERDHKTLLAELAEGVDWTGQQKSSDVVLIPAACYPLYPIVSGLGPLPDAGSCFDIQSYCFRREPSIDPCRMQSFRQREHVRVGTKEQVLEFRELWIRRGRAFAEALQLPYEVDVANDAFFGRQGQLLANSQRDQGFKFELLIPVTSTDKPTACVSFNFHEEHFGKTWNLHFADDRIACTACVGFGLERLTLALLAHHGMDTAAWPASVRRELWG